MTALYIVLGICALLLVLGGIGVWLFLRSEQGQRLVEATREGLAVVQEGINAPGTEALRAAGCGQALVMSAERLGEVARIAGLPIGEAGMRGAATLVFCQQGGNAEAPSCANLARTYADSLPDPPERFGLMHQLSNGTMGCQGIYAPDGTLLEPIQ